MAAAGGFRRRSAVTFHRIAFPKSQLQDFKDFRALPRFKVHFCSSSFMFIVSDMRCADWLAWDWMSRGFRPVDDEAAAARR